MNSAPKVLVVSLPKSGTRLAAGVLERLPGLTFRRLGLNRNLRMHPYNLLPGAETCLVGVEQPHEVKLAAVRARLRKLEAGCFGTGHLPYAQNIHGLLDELDVQVVTIVRDPRDVVVSLARFVVSRSAHFLHRYYVSLTSDGDRIRAAILGVHPPDGPSSQGIRAKIELVQGWMQSAFVVRFEDLVGERGGGSRERQELSIMQLAHHLGVGITPQEARGLGKSVFGTSSTFRQGRIGSWRETFDDEVRCMFDDEVGDLLVALGYEA